MARGIVYWPYVRRPVDREFIEKSRTNNPGVKLDFRFADGSKIKLDRDVRRRKYGSVRDKSA